MPLSGIMLVALALRLLLLDRESLWFDESFSWAWSRLPWSMLWGDAARIETSPPLYYSLLKLWTAVAGDSEAGLRSLSAILGTLSVAVVYAIGRLAIGPRVALWGALLTALAPMSVVYGQEARGYALLTLAALVAVWGFLRFLASRTPVEWWPPDAVPAVADARGSRVGLAAYVVGTVVALYTHNTAFVLPLLANVIVLLVLLTRPAEGKRLLVEWVPANVLIVFTWSWWLPTIYAQATKGAPSLDWMTQPDPGRALLLFLGLYGPGPNPWLGAWGALLVPVPLLVVLALRPAARPKPPLLMLLMFMAGQPLLVWSLGAVFRPMMILRTIVWPLGIGLLAIAAGVLAIGSDRIRQGCIALLLPLQLAGLAGYFAWQRKEAWRDAVQTVAARAGSQDLIAVYPGVVAFPVAYYIRATDLRRPFTAVFRGAAPRDLFDVPNAGVDDLRIRVTVDALRAAARNETRLWLVLFRPLSASGTDTTDQLAASLGGVVATHRIDNKLRVLEIEPTRTEN